MSNYATENLRTLALVGHGSCGKTTLIEAMLYRAGMIPEMGSIQRGTTMCDNDLLEKEVGHSIRLAVAHIDTAMTDLTPVRIHILDTPGYPDYLGQDMSALDAAKSVCAVIDPTKGPELLTRRLMAMAEERGLSQYVHGSRIGVLVDMVGGCEDCAHDVAMHIAASKPKAIDETGIDQALIESEHRIAIEKAREAGKPEAMLERIAEGSVKKFLKEVTLVNQPFVKDDKKSVGDLLKSVNAKVAAYALYVVGEGIEKRVDDFAAEVAAQQAAAAKA